MENVAIKYIESTITRYTGDEEEFEKYILSFLKILDEGLLSPHYRFEEEEICPLFPQDPLISELIEEHEEMRVLKEDIKLEGMVPPKRLLDILRHNIKKEDEELPPRLDHLLKNM